MSNYKVYIIIVTFNDLKHALECLESLEKLKKERLQIKILVVDNASFKFNPQILKKKFPKIILIENDKNLGFGRANNIGIRIALAKRADFVLILNPDTKVTQDKNFIKKLIKTADSDKNIGILGPCIQHRTGQFTLYDYGGILNINLARAWHINKKKYLSGDPIERDFVTGACMLVKREVFEKAGFFDPGYFLYLEDVDFCLKVRKAGFKIVNVPSSKIFHFKGTSISDTKKIYYSFLSSLRFTVKWTPLIFKPVSVIYNVFFYTYLLISWFLKRLIKGVFKKKLC